MEELSNNLIEECKDILTEAVFTSRWSLVEGYWTLGQRLREETSDMTKIVQLVAVGLRIKERTIWYAIQFFDKYPSLDTIPEGKNISWHKICNKYLPEPKEPKEKEIKEEITEKEIFKTNFAQLFYTEHPAKVVFLDCNDNIISKYLIK